MVPKIEDRTMTTQAIPQGKLRPMEEIGTYECAKWRDGHFSRFGALRDSVQRHYQWIGSTEDHVAANRWLAEAVIRLKLGRTGLKIDSTQDELVDAANALAKACSFRIHKANRRAGPKATILRIREQVERVGVPFPLKTEPKQASPDEIAGALARASDEGWWKRQLSRWQPKALEAFNRDLGLVSYQTGAYISNLSFARRQGRKRSNRRLLEKLEAENDQGQTYTLAELADLSVSNPEIRRTELMVRMRGFEDLANQSPGKYTGLFFTVTCPSKYHAAFKTGRRNPKHNGTTPAEAQAYLNTVWQRVRAEWNRKGITPFGMRVAEPHHDGTPHWHLLLLIPTEQAEQAAAIFKRYALQEDGDEPGAAERRFTTEIIDTTKGSATGYIAKYISKNIDGRGIDADLYGLDAKQSAQRIEAWASVWGIRQFQQIGGASVTVWRELRRLDTETIEKTLLIKLIKAADEADWETYTELMGGPICARKERPLRPMMINRETLNKYGEAVKALKGLLYGTERITTRIHEWVISFVNDSVKGDSTGADISDTEPRNPQNANPYLLAPLPNFTPLEFCQQLYE